MQSDEPKADAGLLPRGDAGESGSRSFCFRIKRRHGAVRSIGILTRERDGYVYPYNEQASAVREAFESALMAFEKFSCCPGRRRAC